MSDINDIISGYRKRFSKPLLTGNDLPEVEVVSTGLFVLDKIVIRRGGFPKARIIELSSKEGTGKTTLMGKLVAEYQRLGKSVAYFDAENRLDRRWFVKLGVDLENAFFPDAIGEDILTETKYFVSQGIDLIVLDSVNFITPSAIMERENELAKMNEQQSRAKMWKQFTAELQSGFKVPGIKTELKLSQFGTTVVLLNHIFKDQDGYIEREETLGGNGIKNAASLRIFMKKVKDKPEVEDGKEILKVRVWAIKNSIAPPFGKGVIQLNLTDGEITDDWSSIIDDMKAKGKVGVRGSRYYIEAEGVASILMDKEQLIEKLRNDDTLLEKLL